LIGVSHNGDNIAEHVESVLDDFFLKDKDFAVTIDNAFVNVVAMKVQGPKLYSYDNCTIVLHQRCEFHCR
jgi:hypothetical protein